MTREQVPLKLITEGLITMAASPTPPTPGNVALYFLNLGLVVARIDPQVGRAMEDVINEPLSEEEEMKGWAAVDQHVADMRRELEIDG